LELSDYRSMIYRLIFSLAALYNIAFGVWACFWPGALFAMLKMAAPNYPSLWQCLGMVVGLYGILYAYGAIHLDRAKLIIAIGLAGKILGPLGMLIAFHSGEWPLRAITLIVFNDLVWWLPFTVFLLEGSRIRRTAAGERAVELRHSQCRCRTHNVLRSTRRDRDRAEHRTASDLQCGACIVVAHWLGRLDDGWT
jgi:hypothetical protein